MRAGEGPQGMPEPDSHVQMLEAVTGSVQCLSYERGRNEILMRGYKFAAAKLTAAAALGCLASANADSWRMAEVCFLTLPPPKA